MTNILLQLIKIRLSATFGGFVRSGDRSKKGNRIGKIILFSVLLAYCAVVFLGMFAALFYVICEPYTSLGIGWLYFTIAAVISLALCFIGNVFAAQSQLYNSKDNELLLSMPIPSSFILAGRVISLVITALIYECVVMLPAIVVWSICGKLTAMSFIGWLVLFITVPFFATALSAIVGSLIALITAKIKIKKNLLTIIFSTLFLAAYFGFFNNLSTYTQMLLDKAELLANIIKTKIFPLYALGLAGEGNPIMILGTIIVSTALFALVYFFLSKTFTRISIIKSGAPRVKYKRGREKVRSPFAALVKKEFSVFISSATYVMNAGMGVIMSVLLAAVIFIKSDILTDLFGAIQGFEGIITAMMIFLGMELASLTTISAASVSIEGSKIYLSQVMPIAPANALLAKVVNHAIVSEVGVLAVGISAAIMIPENVLTKIMFIIAPTAMNIFCAFIGVVMNLAFPKLDWINEAVAIKQGFGVLFAMLISTVTSAIYIAAALLTSAFISAEICALIYSAVLILASYIMYLYLSGSGARKYSKLGTN